MVTIVGEFATWVGDEVIDDATATGIELGVTGVSLSQAAATMVNISTRIESGPIAAC